jgi:hypothetical protein
MRLRRTTNQRLDSTHQQHRIEITIQMCQS